MKYQLEFIFVFANTPSDAVLYAGGHPFFQADVLLASAPIKIVLLVGLAAWGYLRKTKVA